MTSSKLGKTNSKKDFKLSYLELIQKLYDEHGQQVAGLLTEDEVRDLDYFKSLNQDEFLERSTIFL